MAHYGNQNTTGQKVFATDEEALAWAYSLAAQQGHGAPSMTPFPSSSAQQVYDRGPTQIVIGSADHTQNWSGNGAANNEHDRMGACERCKKLKVKCEYTTNAINCERCLRTGYDCAPTQRKERGHQLAEYERVMRLGG